MDKKRVYCFVDGFNLFHALDNLGCNQNYLKWLDLSKLALSFIKPSLEILKRIYYFSAYPKWLPNSFITHKKYVQALEAVGVVPILGQFKKKDRKCGAACRQSWISHEEFREQANQYFKSELEKLSE
ncbi:MAG: hypothetical protein JW855_03685 [Gammaproteobacteria bacterium]|nr:hypothetical protein [Gammaproteobacteria bacterium]